MPGLRIAVSCLVVACGGNDRLALHAAAARAPSDAAAITLDAALPLPPGVWRHDQVAASDHACAVRADGHVMCWGPNTFGEVGDEPRTPHAVPVIVPNVDHVASVAVGPGVSCAIGTDGHVTCWGSYDAVKWAPHRIAGIDDVAEVAVLSGRTCARRHDGGVWCWVNDGKPPAQVAELGHARRLVGGYAYACVIGDDDRTRCISWWLGPESVPAYQVFDITDAAGAIQIGGSWNGACAVSRAGGVTCWSFADSNGPPALAVQTTSITNAIDLVLGMHGGCAALRDGSVTCFPTPDQPPATPPWGNDYRAIAIGNDMLCGATASGEITCWGNDTAPLGGYPSIPAQRPAEIAGLANADEIALEDDEACTRRRDGTVACWTDGKALERIDVRNAAHVVAGRRFACADVGGKRSCWGTKTWEGCRFHSRDNCQPEHMTKPTIVEPIAIPNAKAIADPCAIDAGGHVRCRIGSTHVVQDVAIAGVEAATSLSPRCAVMRGGRVACWKLDGAGEIVNATAVEGVANAVQVVAGAAHDCALLAGGGVRCWGKNSQGQLGDGTRRARDTPVAVAGVANIVELAAGEAFTCARDKRGTVMCWGSAAGGALGTAGSGANNRDLARAESVANITDAIALRAIAQHACVVHKRGTVTCWGNVSAMPRGADTHATVAEPDVLD